MLVAFIMTNIVESLFSLSNNVNRSTRLSPVCVRETRCNSLPFTPSYQPFDPNVRDVVQILAKLE